MQNNTAIPDTFTLRDLKPTVGMSFRFIGSILLWQVVSVETHGVVSEIVTSHCSLYHLSPHKHFSDWGTPVVNPNK